MEKRESLYLDLIRALSAVIVVIDHAPYVFKMPGSPRWGHQAVIVFYVLSGYVIAAAADRPGMTARSFIISRLARLWSVLIPALLLTVVCDTVGHMAAPGVYADVPSNMPVIRIGAAVLFLSETWVSVLPLSDGVIWSLCAEFWYYMLFAAWTFMPPGRNRWVMLAVLALVSGFKAILLLPIWMLGVALHRSEWIRRLPARWNVALFVGSTAVIAWMLATQFYSVPFEAMLHWTPPWLFRQLAQVRIFWFDWLFGLLVFAHFLGARTVAPLAPIERLRAPIVWCAGVSYAAYLFHAPLEHVLGALIPGLNGWLAVVLTLLIIAVLGPPAERSKRWWARHIDAGARLVQLKLGSPASANPARDYPQR